MQSNELKRQREALKDSEQQVGHVYMLYHHVMIQQVGHVYLLYHHVMIQQVGHVYLLYSHVRAGALLRLVAAASAPRV